MCGQVGIALTVLKLWAGNMKWSCCPVITGIVINIYTPCSVECAGSIVFRVRKCCTVFKGPHFCYFTSGAGLVTLLLAYCYMKFNNFSLPPILSWYLDKKLTLKRSAVSRNVLYNASCNAAFLQNYVAYVLYIYNFFLVFCLFSLNPSKL